MEYKLKKSSVVSPHCIFTFTAHILLYLKYVSLLQMKYGQYDFFFCGINLKDGKECSDLFLPVCFGTGDQVGTVPNAQIVFTYSGEEKHFLFFPIVMQVSWMWAVITYATLGTVVYMYCACVCFRPDWSQGRRTLMCNFCKMLKTLENIVYKQSRPYTFS